MDKSPGVVERIDPFLEQAIQDLRGHLKSHPDDISSSVALDGLARALFDRTPLAREGDEDIPQVLLDLGGLLAGHPGAMLRLSKVFIDRKEHAIALRYASEGLATDPDDPDLLFNHALCLLHTQQLDDGITELKQYIKLQPENPWAYNNLGDAYRSLGYFDRAEEYFHLAVQQDEHFAPAYYNMAMLCMDQGDWERCAHFARIAERYKPMDKNVQLALGDSYYSLKLYEASAQHLLAATLIDKQFVEAFETLSATYADLGMPELGLASARQALKLDPNSWMALANIGYNYVKLGDFKKAIDFELRALEKNPDENGSYNISWELGWGYFKVADYEQAESFTRRALRAKEYPDPMIRFNLGLILLARGEVSAAAEAYRDAFRYTESDEHAAIVEQAMGELVQFIDEKSVHFEDSSDFAMILKQHLGTL